MIPNTRKLVLGLAAALLIGCVVAPAQAQLPSARAEALNNEGKDLFGKGRYLEAADKFQAALDVDQRAKYAFNLAYAWLNSGTKAKEARDMFLRYLELCRGEEGGRCPDEDRVQQEITRLEDVLFRELPRVSIHSDPAGAIVYFTDPGTATERVIGQTPHEARLAQGTYQIRLEKDGYEPFGTTFEVQRQGDLNLAFPLTKFRNVGSLRIGANVRGARIYVDGKVYGLSPRKDPLEVEAGSHQVIVEKDGYTRFETEVSVTAGQTVPVEADIYLVDAPATWKSYVGWPTAVIGLLGIGAGITFWQLADKEFRGTPTFNDYELYQNLGYGLGGGLLAVGTGLIIWEYAAPAVGSGDSLAARPVLLIPPEGGMVFGIGGRL